MSFYERLESFGLTKRTGISLSGEPKPTVYKPETDQWHPLSLPSMAIGYEVRQTPLQTLTFYNSVANNGTMVKPQIVYQIRRGAEVIKTFSPVVMIEQVCSDETLRKLKKCLEGVMQKGGTGSRLTSSQFTIAGKTGTAKLPGKDKRYGAKGQGDFQASFVGYFPANKPIYSCIVVISAPSKNIYGGKVSGTVFAAVANKVFASNLQYHKAINETKKRKGGVPSALNGNVHDLARIYRMLKVPFAVAGEGEWMLAGRGKSKAVLRSRKFVKGLVPDLTGMSARDAVYMIESLGMTAHVVGFGKVAKQSVPVGRPVYRGGVIELILN
jgi:cell division protein FtsI (penicillin-binding protein 3)